MEVWAGELGGSLVLGCRCPPEEHGAMLRAALGHGATAMSLGPEEPQCLALALAQLPAAEARSQLQALFFGMAEAWRGAWKALALALVSVAVETLASSCSPVTNAAQSQQLFCQADLSPMTSRAFGSALVAKMKVLRESLINPSFKSKQVPSGVNFEDS